MHLILAAALLATSGAGQDPFCNEIGKLAAGARESTPFETFHRTGDPLNLIPGGYCRLSSQRNWICGKSLLPPEITQASMAQRIAACLPDMTVVPGETRYGNRRSVVSGNGLVFELSETGSDRGHIGRILSIFIRAER
ncbi:hypothetical protein P1X14_14345 [Sphingomonas sp. AOB5]|uniref:hypothetical protein n=1 Tax=Sphingomonas sp. AOB5 TaxID=3034017 RepID=UPI0023F8384E|nr:hypothetical protein [Sphingomonas sp. AOB5]MDF7776431.1 hypothetical protein [Sphingomonas sp. AOB5]